jgi:class 3 adenylate cyclase
MESEYRPTTVMFCNFSGPEALLEAWGTGGEQRVTGLLNAYFTVMNEVITRYGGVVSRIDPYSKGSKMLILFGAPVAHEDDPQRAVSGPGDER